MAKCHYLAVHYLLPHPHKQVQMVATGRCSQLAKPNYLWTAAIHQGQRWKVEKVEESVSGREGTSHCVHIQKKPGVATERFVWWLVVFGFFLFAEQIDSEFTGSKVKPDEFILGSC